MLHNHHTENHHHHAHTQAALLRRDGSGIAGVFYWAIGLNLAYVVLEGICGFRTGSMGLLSDAGHNLSDVASLLIALLAFNASNRPATPAFSYGYGKATIEASLANAVILYVAVIFIAAESVRRLVHPAEVNGLEIAWIAAAGVFVNGLTAWMLMHHSRYDLNVRGAFLHMAADTLVSLGVVASGIIIRYTGQTWVDPVVGLCIAAVIAVGSWSLLHKSMRLALDGVPPEADIPAIEETIMSVDGVRSFHHLHVWAMSTTRTALTVHVLVDDASHIDRVISELRRTLRDIGVDHATIEAETSLHTCGCSGLDHDDSATPPM